MNPAEDNIVPLVPPLPPHNSEVEQALLGAILTNNNAYDQIRGRFDLRAEHFFEPVHAAIYQTAAALIDNGEVASPITLKHRLENDPLLRDVGGFEYLADLASSVLSVVSARDYAQTIVDLHARRKGVQLMADTTGELCNGSDDRPASVVLASHEEQLDAIRSIGPEQDAEHISGPSMRMLEHADLAMQGKAPAGIQTGFVDLDRVLGGLHKADLCLLGARPGMGKTALATKIATHVAKEQGPVMFATMEMTAEQLSGRIICAKAGVEFTRVRAGKIDTGEFQHLAQCERELASSPLHIFDNAGLTMPSLRTACRRMKRKTGLSLLVVDYLGLITPTRDQARRSRYEQVSEISRQMKLLAKTLNIPILCLLQLSRASEQRDNKMPIMSDLRDSGSLEQDADQILFIHRAHEVLRKKEPQRENYDNGLQGDMDHANDHSGWVMQCAKLEHEAKLVVGKNRHGSQATIDLYFDGSTMRFDNAAKGLGR